MKIRTRLTVAFVGLAVIMLLMAGLALKALADEDRRFEHYVEGIDARLAAAAELRTAVDQRAIAARNLVLVTRPEDIEQERNQVVKAHENTARSIARLDAMIAKDDGASDEERRLVVELDRVEKAYAPVALAIVDLALKGRKDEAIARMNDDCRPLLAALSKVSDEYARVASVTSRALTAEAEAEFRLQRNILLGGCLLALALALFSGLRVTRSVTQPIDRAVALAEAVAAGDLTQAVDSRGRDEAARLLASLGAMSRRLREIVGSVRGSSDSIATGAAEIAGGNADLSSRTERQASSLQETAASLEELSAAVRRNADSARRANQMSLAASTVASQGGAAVGEVVATMKSIEQSSRRIADIIGVIDGIAFQTNILALNASVEAARAGEQGRGFAVVAAEVRGLASRSADAAREIKLLIGTSVERVEQGAALADRAGATMNEVVASVQRVSAIVQEISDASQAQSGGVTQVNEAVAELDRVTQQNAALVEQSAAAAESLKRQARQLVQAVAVFDVGIDQPAPAA